VDTENSMIYMEFVQGTIVKDLLVANSEYIHSKEKLGIKISNKKKKIVNFFFFF